MAVGIKVSNLTQQDVIDGDVNIHIVKDVDGTPTSFKTNVDNFIYNNSITTAKIADANVTTAKIADANVTFAKLTDVIDDDTMATATDTTLATSESIKAYVDATAGGFTPSTYAGEESVTLPNGLIMKFGSITSGIPTYGVEGTITFANSFNTACLFASIITNNYAGTASANNTIESVSVSNIKYKHGMFSPTKLNWQALGH